MNKAHTVFLRPVTSLYFGRPGSLPAGEAHVGISWFPPPISAFQGMIRTKLLQEAGVFQPEKRVEELVGTPEALPDDWALNGPFPACYPRPGELQLWFPMPCFLLPPLDRSRLEPVVARPLSSGDGYPELVDDEMQPEGLSDKHDSQPQRLQLAGAPAEAKLKSEACWISSGNLYWAFSQGHSAYASLSWRPEECSRDLPPFVRRETRTGLARQKDTRGTKIEITGRAEEGMLYFLSALRFSPLSGFFGSLKAELSNPLSSQALEQGPILAGKKGGVLAFEKPDGQDIWWSRLEAGEHLANCPVPDGALVWISLLTPGCWGSAAALLKLLHPGPELTVELVSFLGHAPIFLGGFSLAKKRQRPVRSWYPAGTSILVRLTGGTEEARRDCLLHWNNNCLLVENKTERPFGYGHILVSAPLNDGGNHG